MRAAGGEGGQDAAAPALTSRDHPLRGSGEKLQVTQTEIDVLRTGLVTNRCLSSVSKRNAVPIMLAGAIPRLYFTTIRITRITDCFTVT